MLFKQMVDENGTSDYMHAMDVEEASPHHLLKIADYLSATLEVEMHAIFFPFKEELSTFSDVFC
jgi:hypothetical protein